MKINTTIKTFIIASATVLFFNCQAQQTPIIRPNSQVVVGRLPVGFRGHGPVRINPEAMRNTNLYAQQAVKITNTLDKGVIVNLVNTEAAIATGSGEEIIIGLSGIFLKPNSSTTVMVPTDFFFFEKEGKGLGINSQGSSDVLKHVPLNQARVQVAGQYNQIIIPLSELNLKTGITITNEENQPMTTEVMPQNLSNKAREMETGAAASRAVLHGGRPGTQPFLLQQEPTK